MSADYNRIHDPERTEHYVYRLYGRRNSLIYIGCSMNLRIRLAEHRRRFDGQIVRVEVDGPFNYTEARRLEREQIQALRPKRNVEWTPKHRRGVSTPRLVSRRAAA